jgi:hypothetical protein
VHRIAAFFIWSRGRDLNSFLIRNHGAFGAAVLGPPQPKSKKRGTNAGQSRRLHEAFYTTTTAAFSFSSSPL